MKRPLHIADVGEDQSVRIADANHKIICKMEIIQDGREVAELIVAKINGGLWRRCLMAWGMASR